MTITVYYTSIDGYRQTEVCVDIAKAREWAQYWIGKHPEIGGHYAVSGDGVGKISCAGCRIRDLFPEEG